MLDRYRSLDVTGLLLLRLTLPGLSNYASCDSGESYTTESDKSVSNEIDWC